MLANRTGGLRRSVAALAAAAALVLTACPADDDDPAVEEPPGENGLTPEKEDPPEDEEPAEDAEAVTLELVAENTSFDEDTLTVPAGAQVTVEFDNRDAIGHNFALYETDAADEVIFQGEIVSEPTTYEFTAPDEPGTYYFQCDPHAEVMNGQFIVEEE